MSEKKKFYGVRQGRTPGIYTDWDSCKAQVIGFKGAEFKGFMTEEEVRAYLDNPQPAPLEDSLIMEAYVDGSYIEGRFSYGMVVLWGGEGQCFCEEVFDESLATMHNVAGEIKGAEAAMRYAEEMGAEELVIYHDYAGIAKWALGEWKANLPGTQAYRDFAREMGLKFPIRFVKVKGHSGNQYNEKADALAKQALGLK